MTAASELAGFIAKFTPAIAAQTRAILAAMRRRLPGALELVYDNYNALAIGFSPTERASGVVFSIAVYPRWVSLFFFASGARLDDPDGVLRGTGTQVRHIVLDDGAATLDRPAVKRLVVQALAIAGDPFGGRGKRRLIIKSIAATQRPRRPAAATATAKARASSAAAASSTRPRRRTAARAGRPR